MQSLLQGLSDFNNAGVTIGDTRVLDSSEKNIAIITPGAPGPGREDYEGTEIAWIEHIDLFKRWDTNLATTWTKFRNLRQNVIDDFVLPYPTLNHLTDVQSMRLTAEGSRAPELWMRKNDGGIDFIMQRMSVEVREWYSPTSGEYA